MSERLTEILNRLTAERPLALRGDICPALLAGKAEFLRRQAEFLEPFPVGFDAMRFNPRRRQQHTSRPARA